MARPNPVFVCSACGGETLKWQGQCPLCGEWNSLEQRAAPAPRPRGAGRRRSAARCRSGGGAARAQRLATRPGGARPGPRRRHRARVGDPAGRRPGHRQIDPAAAGRRARRRAARPVLYASGEESVAQVGLRARRLGVERRGARAWWPRPIWRRSWRSPRERRAALLVVDSIQTVQSAAVGAQRRCASRSCASAPRSWCASPSPPAPPSSSSATSPRRAPSPARAARAPGRHGAVLRERGRQPLPHRARHQEPLRRGQRARLLRHDRGRAEGSAQPVGDLPRARAGAGARAASSR